MCFLLLAYIDQVYLYCHSGGSSALNIALKEEFQRLKIATGEVGTNGHLRSREDHLLADKPFYRTQPIPDTTGLATQQLQQIRSALRKQQHVNHPNNSLA